MIGDRSIVPVVPSRSVYSMSSSSAVDVDAAAVVEPVEAHPVVQPDHVLAVGHTGRHVDSGQPQRGGRRAAADLLDLEVRRRLARVVGQSQPVAMGGRRDVDRRVGVDRLDDVGDRLNRRKIDLGAGATTIGDSNLAAGDPLAAAEEIERGVAGNVVAEAETECTAGDRIRGGLESRAEQLLALGRPQGRELVASAERLTAHGSRQLGRVAAGGLLLVEQAGLAQVVGDVFHPQQHGRQLGDGRLLGLERLGPRRQSVPRLGRELHQGVNRVFDVDAGDQPDRRLDTSHGGSLSFGTLPLRCPARKESVGGFGRRHTRPSPTGIGQKSGRV